MTRYITATTHGGTVHAPTNARGGYRQSKRQPTVIAVVKCAVCHIKRQCVNQVCDVCRANGAGTP